MSVSFKYILPTIQLSFKLDIVYIKYCRITTYRYFVLSTVMLPIPWGFFICIKRDDIQSQEQWNIHKIPVFVVSNGIMIGRASFLSYILDRTKWPLITYVHNFTRYHLYFLIHLSSFSSLLHWPRCDRPAVIDAISQCNRLIKYAITSIHNFCFQRFLLLYPGRHRYRSLQLIYWNWYHVTV